ncbi:hypothetical protein HYV73_00815 [Candidatus Uhrbacteria bacterium]|nr:hypothetical protein [Candidatus Uhrbacteria bacterium]
MKFYKAKHSTVGDGVEATVVYHKDNGDELVHVREGFDEFEKLNPDAKAQTTEEADKLIEKAAIRLAVPTKTELRKENKLSLQEIEAEIQNEATSTADISVVEEKDDEGKPVQKLTYFEHREIKSVEDFLAAQEGQKKELAHEPVEEPIETKTDTEEKL